MTTLRETWLAAVRKFLKHAHPVSVEYDFQSDAYNWYCATCDVKGRIWHGELEL